MAVGETATAPVLPLVGRDSEIAAITDSIDRVEDGFGQTILVTGPPGIGKSRLMDEMARICAERSFGLLRGRARPVDSRLAYAPILQAVGRAVRAMEPPERTKLLRGLESLGLILEDLDLAPPAPLGDPALERTRLFASTVRLIDRMNAQRPTLLMIEDLQWIDPASKEMISFVASELVSLPVLLALSCDSEERPTSVRELTHELRMRSATTELSLQPLMSPHVGQIVENFLGQPMRPADVDLLADIAGGNPFLTVAYIDEMRQTGSLKLIENRWAMVKAPRMTRPPVAAEFYRARIDSLDPQERTLVEIVAVGGGEVSHEDLQALSGFDDSQMAESIQHMVSSGLLVAEGEVIDTLYRCSHSLITEVAYAEIPLFRRRQIHAAFINILEARADRSERLVWHFQNVGDEADQKQRLAVLADAGRRASDSHAGSDAVEFLGTALEIARAIGATEAILQLLEDLGTALHQNGEERAAIEIWRSAEDLASDPSHRALLLRRMAVAESNLGHFANAKALVADGVEKLSGENTGELFELQWVATLNSFRAGDIAAAEAGTRLFSEMVAANPTARGSMSAAVMRTGLSLEHGSYEAAGSLAEEAYAAAVGLNDLVAQQQALAFLALVDVSLGNLEALSRHLHINQILTEEIGILLRAYRIVLYQFVGDIYKGDWEHAHDLAVEAGVLAEQLPESRNQVVLIAMPALLDILEGDFEAAGLRLERARNAISSSGNVDPGLSAMIDILDAWSDLEAGDTESALAKLEARNGEFLQGLLPPWGLILLGEARARIGGANWVDVADQLVAMGTPQSLPRVWNLRIQALGSDDPGLAAELWTEVTKGFDALGMPFEAARATLDRAELQVTNDAQTVTDLTEIHQLFSDLGAKRYRDRAAHQLRARGSTPVPEAGTSDQRLSRRQAEVAALVAEGMTNAQIAERLFIGQRTVTTHLENIYRQLGINTRTALTRYVLGQKPGSSTISSRG